MENKLKKFFTSRYNDNYFYRFVLYDFIFVLISAYINFSGGVTFGISAMIVDTIDSYIFEINRKNKHGGDKDE